MQRREVLTKSIFLFVLLGSILTIIRDKDDVFPFSNYPMYSNRFEPYPNFITFTVLVSPSDGSPKRLISPGLIPPFWGASFREALFVDPRPAAVSLKLTAAFHWINERQMANGRPQIAALQLYRHDLPWNEFFRRRIEKEEFKSLYVQHSRLLTQARSEK